MTAMGHTDDEVLVDLDFAVTLWCSGIWAHANGSASKCQLEATHTAKCPSCDRMSPICPGHVQSMRRNGTRGLRCPSCSMVFHTHEFTIEPLGGAK